METPRVNYRTNSHQFPNLGALIGGMMGVGLVVVFLTISLGLGPILSVVMMLGSMVIFMGCFSGATDFIVDEKGLYKHIQPYIPYKLFKKEQTIFHPWAEVKNFKAGSDMSRSLESYEYLEITFRNHEVWQVMNKSNADAFNQFRLAFMLAVKDFNQGVSPVLKTEQVPNPKPTLNKTSASTAVPNITQQHHFPSQLIEEKKTLYETVWAKIFFWVIFIGMAWLLYWAYSNDVNISGTNIFRITFVIVPGLIYVYYRIYGKKNTSSPSQNP